MMMIRRLHLLEALRDEPVYSMMRSKAEIQIGDVWDATSIANPPPLLPGVVHLWQRRLDASAAELNERYGVLSNLEKKRAQRFRVERARNEFVLTRAALRVLLGQYLGCVPREIRFQYTERGKPAVEGESRLCFNVSHTAGLALMAFVRERAIGVDVESLGRETDAARLAERFFSERERQALRHLSGSDLHAAFFRCWTRKEAYIKAKGEGLSMPLHQFDVSTAEGDRDALLGTRPDPAEARRWIVCDVELCSGYAAAVAVAEG